jgi:gliding motility-associated-like protein
LKTCIHFIAALLSWLSLNAQCPDITQTTVNPNCIPNCELCSGDKFTVTLQGGDLPHNGTIDYYISETPGFNPYNGEGTKIGSANISTPNPPCRICPVLLGFMIDACGLEPKNEFIIIWTGSGFNTGGFVFDYAATNNTGGAPNADIQAGGCGITNGNPALVGGCTAIPVGLNYNLPPNSIWIVFTSVTAFTNYDFSSACALACKVFVSSSTCDRTIGAFSNFDATPGLRTQNMYISGCMCSSSAMYDIPGSLTGQGDFWAEGSIVNNGCATPSFSQPNYTPSPSTIDPFTYTIPQSWCDKANEIVGIINPKPDVNCCMEEFTERFTVNVKCPKANSASLEMCELSNGQSIFTLEDADAIVLNGSNGSVVYFKDIAGTNRIYSPYTSGNATIYAKVVDGKCSSNLVPVTLTVFLLPVAKPASAEICDISGFANFDLKQLEQTIKNGNNATSVMFFQDLSKTIPINSPYYTSSTVIYATISDSKCESNPVEITLTVLKVPEAFEASSSACPDSSGKATFKLTDLIPIITNNESGVTVKFYEDDLQLKGINSPYKSSTDTIFAVVSNGKCESEPVAIILKVSSLNSLTLVTDKNCDDGNGNAIFDLINAKKLLQQGDSSVKVRWYADSTQTTELFPPVIIQGTDTIYAYLFKDSCKSKHIPIILEAIKRPVATSFTWTVCSTTGESVFWILNSIKDYINLNSGLNVVFSKDSLMTDLITGDYYSAGDTLYAATQDGNCLSLPVKLILQIIKAPSFVKTADLIVCDHLVLFPLNGHDLTPNASYYSTRGITGTRLSVGDTIWQSGFIYMRDSLGNCVAEDSFYIDVNRQPQAGADQSISVCEGNIVNLNQYLSNADAGGTFYDIDNSGSLTDSIFNSLGHNGFSYRFAYVLNANSYCPGDTAFISINIVKKLFAGDDYTDTICEGTILSINPFLRGADSGGQLIDSLNTGALTPTSWNSAISGAGTYVVKYVVGDDITCPKDVSYITIVVQSAILIDNIGGQLGCGFYVLPPITGKNVIGRTHYYSLANRNGTRFNPGDTIKNSQRIYISGIEPGFCSDEDTFFIVISPPIFGKTLDVPLCYGDSILIGTTYYGINHPFGIEKFDTPAANGCDSFYMVAAAWAPLTDTLLNKTLCETEFLMINNTRYDITHTSGQEILDNVNRYGCDSIINIDLQFLPGSKSTYTTNLCRGEQIIINGNLYDENKTTGIDTLKNVSVNGCDSIVNVTVQSVSPSTFTYRNTICPSESVVLGNTSFNKSNPVLIDTLKGMSVNGCDSIIDIQLSFLPDATGNINQTLCENQFLLINGKRYDKSHASGQEIFPASSVNGCDSILNVLLNFKNSVSQNYAQSICENESVVINGKNYDKSNLSGIDTLSGQASGGCDSIVIIQLSLIPNKQTFITDSLCPGESIVINGKTYNEVKNSGKETLTALSGCDSIVTVNLLFSDLDLNYTREIFLVPGQSQTLQIIPNFTPASITWSPSTGLSCTDCLNPVATPTQTTTYIVTITDESGCIITAQITVRLDVVDDVFVPNVFSPNGDNINDQFKIISDNINLIISDFAIYDRWGNQVYYESNRTPVTHRGWDGSTTTNEKLNPGVYVYYIRLKIPGAEDKILYGDVSLIR